MRRHFVWRGTIGLVEEIRGSVECPRVPHIGETARHY